MNGKTEVVKRVDASPDEMIRLAIDKGADLEKLGKLMELQRQYETNEARKAYHKAMSAFKANPPKIDKDRTVAYGNTRYNHASLANVVEKITKALSDNGLCATWRTHQNGQIVVTCVITHEMGHSEETTLSAPADVSGAKNAIQSIGSTITYLERYTLLAATGLATYEQDDDGVASSPVVERIDEKQIGVIRDYLTATEADEAKFLKYMGIESLEAMPKSSYAKAVSALKVKAEKGAKK